MGITADELAFGTAALVVVPMALAAYAAAATTRNVATGLQLRAGTRWSLKQTNLYGKCNQTVFFYIINYETSFQQTKICR